jgi:hypothetical protein
MGLHQRSQSAATELVKFPVPSWGFSSSSDYQSKRSLHSTSTPQGVCTVSNFAGLIQPSNSSRHPLRAKVGQLAYWSAVAVIFAWAAWLRFRLPLDPIAVPNYVSAALKKLAGGEFGQIHLERTVIWESCIF